MKPFAHHQLSHEKEIFNYRLSRARNSVECAFGRISQMWRILLRQLDSQPTAATDIVKAITVLHNFVIDNEPHRRVVATQDFQHVPTQQSLGNERRQRHKRPRSTKSALNVRESFMRYFNSDAGSVPWQNEKCFNM